MKRIEMLYAEMENQFRQLEKLKSFKDKIVGYEAALWDFKVSAKDLFGIELPEIKPL